MRSVRKGISCYIERQISSDIQSEVRDSAEAVRLRGFVIHGMSGKCAGDID